MNEYYPISLDVRNKNCIVIGAGLVAKRKISRLLASYAKVTLISQDFSPEFKKLVENKQIEFKKKMAGINDIKKAFLVICATNDRNINKTISAYCHKNNILINVVDSPAECGFILPSIVKRGNLTISISTQGVSPALASKIRRDLEKQFGAEYAKFLSVMNGFRQKVIKEITDIKLRKAYFKKATEQKMLNFCKTNKPVLIKKKLEQMLVSFKGENE